MYTSDASVTAVSPRVELAQSCQLTEVRQPRAHDAGVSQVQHIELMKEPQMPESNIINCRFGNIERLDIHEVLD